MVQRIIDLSQNTVYGWEDVKYVETIDAIIRGIEAGDEIPPVPIIETSEGFVLDPFFRVQKKGGIGIDGGHNRALAYYFLGRGLPADVIKGKRPPNYQLILLGEIRILSNPLDYQKRRSVQPYR